MKTITIRLDSETKKLAKTLLLTEGQLVVNLGEMRTHQCFLEMGYRGVFEYCEGELSFSRAQSYYFKSVVEKAETVPELKDAIVRGDLTFSQARRIATVITPQNKSEWIQKARELPQLELEREVSANNPRAFTKERIRPMTGELSELKTPVDLETEKDIKALQDVLSQKLGKAASLQEVVKWMAKECREKFDPIKKAERAKSKKVSSGNAKPLPGRRPRPAVVNHEVVLRDENRCTFVSSEGKRCSQKRWLQSHHVIEVSRGGLNEAGNLQLLCSGHHRMKHRPSTEPSAKLP